MNAWVCCVADFGNSQWRRGEGSRRTPARPSKRFWQQPITFGYDTDRRSPINLPLRSGRHIYTPLLPRLQMLHSHCNPQNYQRNLFPIICRLVTMATITKLDWNAHKAIIRSLYLDENRKLAEVMRMMATEHKFPAT